MWGGWLNGRKNNAMRTCTLMNRCGERNGRVGAAHNGLHTMTVEAQLRREPWWRHNASLWRSYYRIWRS